MSRRDHGEARCPTCLMYAGLCICELVPRLATRARLLLLVHYEEARKPTNTGQLAARCLTRSDVELVGDRARPLRLPLVRAGERPLLLFPADDAVPLADVAFAPADRVVLIVPDGTWRQASKMRRRVPGLAELPCVTLPGGGTTYRLRTEARAEGLATLEAIARAFAILEGERGPAIQHALLDVFRVMVDRTLWLRGALPTAAVTGGVPAAALADRLRRAPPERS